MLDRFLVRWVILQVATAFAGAAAEAVVSDSPHWSDAFDLRFVLFISVLGVPAALFFAAAARTPAQLFVAATAIVLYLIALGQQMAGTASSTAGLIFLQLPFVGTFAGAVAFVVRVLRDERRRSSDD